MTSDLLALTAQLVDIPSVSHGEAAIVQRIEMELEAAPWLSVDRVGDNLVARTDLGRDLRLILGGHTDTVPANGNEVARIEGDVLWGLGSADMKGGIASMLTLALTAPEPAVDVTYVFYAREEIALAHNGLRELFAARPDLLEGDVALLGEPTSGVVEAGCQGTMRLELTLAGERAHTARAWMGRNAIHRLEAVLELINRYEPRRPLIDDCEYREAMQVVAVDGGVAGNVVPDACKLTIGHRFAPDRSASEAEAHVRALLGPALEPADDLVVTDVAPAAAPSLRHPLLKALIETNQLEVRAKLGWTDVAFFAERGVPAANFGPGDAEISHTAQESLDAAVLASTHEALVRLLATGAA
jgi:succinyl-diaminopimelate desuccinylase